MITDEIVEKFYPGSTSKRYVELFPQAARRERLNAELLHFGFSDLWPDEDVVTGLERRRGSCMDAADGGIIDRLLATYGDRPS
jgi:hypothetical protein